MGCGSTILKLNNLRTESYINRETQGTVISWRLESGLYTCALLKDVKSFD